MITKIVLTSYMQAKDVFNFVLLLSVCNFFLIFNHIVALRV